MKKLFLKVVTVMLLLTMILPLSANAATSLVTKTPEILAGETVEIEVTTEESQSIQFDLQYDPTKYEYVFDSATSDLDTTDSNYISEDVIRVSAFDMNGSTTDTVKLQFKAKKGTGVGEFKIASTVEIVDKNGTLKTEVQPEEKLTVKINGETITPGGNPEQPENPDQSVGNGDNKESGEYVDEKTGEKIKTLGKWGEIPPIRIYENLTNLAGKNIVAYALTSSDEILSKAQLQKEFGNQIVVADDVLGTGKTFTLNGEVYTILVYGDVNGDGRVTTADALTTRKAELGKIRTLTEVQKEALDVVKIDGKDDGTHTANALAIQNFILGNKYRENDTKTVVDKYPEEAGNLIDGIMIDNSSYKTEDPYRYQTVKVAEVSTKNIETTNTEKIRNEKSLTYELTVEGVGTPVDAEVTFEPIQGKDDTYLMSLYTPYIGKHTITPILVGANVKGGVFRDEEKAIEIEIQDNNEVSEVVLKDENGDPIKDAQGNYVKEVEIRAGKEKEVEVGFIHRYRNDEGEVVADVPLSVATATITGTTGSIANAEFVANEEDGNITALKVKTTDAENTTGTITISVGNITEALTINVIEKAKTVGIKLNGTEVTNTTGVTEIAPISLDKVNETRIPIQLINEDKETVDLVKRNIETEGYEIEVDDIDTITMGELEAKRKEIDNTMTGKLVIYEAGKDGVFTAMNISVESYKWEDGDNGEAYYPATVTSGVDAIGIRLASDLDNVENLKDGLMIAYDSVDAQGNACRRTVKIPVAAAYDVDGTDLLATAESETQGDDVQVPEETQVSPVTTPKTETPEEQSDVPVTTPSTTPEVKEPVTTTPSTTETPKTENTTLGNTTGTTSTGNNTTTNNISTSANTSTGNTSTGTTSTGNNTTANSTSTDNSTTGGNTTSSNDATRTEGAQQDKPGNSSLLAPSM